MSVPLDALDRHALPVRASNSVPNFPQAAVAQPSSEQVLITPHNCARDSTQHLHVRPRVKYLKNTQPASPNGWMSQTKRGGYRKTSRGHNKAIQSLVNARLHPPTCAQKLSFVSTTSGRVLRYPATTPDRYYYTSCDVSRPAHGPPECEIHNGRVSW